ncbi:MAG TPA: phosphoenolpyruvate carboxykinase [Thermomicrobiales bacterium]|jgi:phosphoenolpyruvate carboxykinase (ATP)
MEIPEARRSKYGLDRQGLCGLGNVYWNLSTPMLYEEAIRRQECRLAEMGSMVVRTGQHTGRSPEDKFVVREPTSEDKIWWGKVNRPIDAEHFDRLRKRMFAYLKGKDLFVEDSYVGADPAYRMPVRILATRAWHSLFARTMFIPPCPEQLVEHVPGFTVIQAPGFQAIPETEGTRSGVFILLNFAEKLVLIGGTEYAGEIKKSIFTVMNYLLPQRGILSMHCSANIGADGDVAIFFGLSGTGKTTLSADASRTLVGDDEHGWSDDGIFNFEGGCYAKVIRLSATAEPEIYATTRQFGTILENVGFDRTTGKIDLDDESLTENTRAAYPISFIANASPDGLGGHPKSIFMLTADAFGVMPPIARLTREQAMYHFLSGYTAKVAGTERGVTEPEATFSTCFGAPFMALPPAVYAGLLGERIASHGASVWLVNTGWTGGPYGVGERMAIGHTRALIRAALAGQLDDVPTQRDPVFGVEVPLSCPGVPSEVLTPRATWENPEAYDDQAKRLAGMFAKNFAQFADQVPSAVRDAGPSVG